MSKSLSFVVALLLLNGCSGGIQKAPPPTSAKIEDATLSRFQATENFTPENEDTVLDVPDAECGKDGTGHTRVDSRLTPGTTISKVTKSSKAGESVVQASGQFEVQSNSDDSMTIHDVFTRSGSTYTRDETCRPSGTGPLQCSTSNVAGKPFPKLNNCILVEDPGKNAKPTYSHGGPYTTKSDLKLSTYTDVIVEREGQIVCLGKVEGRGTSVEKTVYSSDLPSLRGDSCTQGKVFYFFQLFNADKSPRETHTEEITGLTYGRQVERL